MQMLILNQLGQLWGNDWLLSAEFHPLFNLCQMDKESWKNNVEEIITSL